jgi:hypothetical protein
MLLGVIYDTPKTRPVVRDIGDLVVPIGVRPPLAGGYIAGFGSLGHCAIAAVVEPSYS